MARGGVWNGETSPRWGTKGRAVNFHEPLDRAIKSSGMACYTPLVHQTLHPANRVSTEDFQYRIIFIDAAIGIITGRRPGSEEDPGVAGAKLDRKI
jgi:hypothetical protein